MFTEDKEIGEPQGPSLDGFIKFLEKQRPEDSYLWTDSCNCACAQYLKSENRFDENWLSSGETMRWLNRIAGCGGASNLESWVTGYKSEDWTFGKCLDRAKRVKELA